MNYPDNGLALLRILFFFLILGYNFTLNKGLWTFYFKFCYLFLIIFVLNTKRKFIKIFIKKNKISAIKITLMYKNNIKKTFLAS